MLALFIREIEALDWKRSNSNNEIPDICVGKKKGGEILLRCCGPYIPLIEPSKLILAFLVPFTASFEIVLVVKPTADGTASRKSLGNIFPLHASPTELDNNGILLGRPLALFLDWLVWNVRCHTAPSAQRERRSYMQRPYT